MRFEGSGQANILRKTGARGGAVCVCACAAMLAGALPGWTQILVPPARPGGMVTMLPSDVAVLESSEERTDLPCVVTPRKPKLGFDLRFHGGFDVKVPLAELDGGEDVLTIVFRVYPQGDKADEHYFSQHVRVPKIDDGASGDALLQGSFDAGEGKFHIDWLMRDRRERICSSNWDAEAVLPLKDKPMPLYLGANQVAESEFEPFQDEPVMRVSAHPEIPLNIKLLVNFAPKTKEAAELPAMDLAALVGILKMIEHDPRVGRVSLVAFNMQEQRVLYRQGMADRINFPALGRAIESLKLGTVTLKNLTAKHGETDFLSTLLAKEVGETSDSDAVIFAGPKAMLDTDVPDADMRRIGDIECPVFYMNYNPDPQQIPWADTISHAVKYLKGTEYTISRPRDLWFATSEMLSQVERSKRLRVEARLGAATGSR